MSTVIRNPILRGFNPDPSIVRVGDDYFIATSTFEWFPGVQIHHSRDLVNWRLLTRPLRRASQLNMLGDPDSCGVWAPDLTYADGRFYLVYTDVKRYGRTTVAGASGASLRDFHNYLVTSTDIDGDWSDPVYLNSSGFDPSLFHDDDGKKYLLNMLWDHRPGQNRFAGIVMQEFSPAEQRLVGERRLIFSGTALGLTEGPHVYKRGGYYHLITAEGGTSWGHAVTMARARKIEGPYELHPDVHVLSARHRPDVVLQRAGHADLVDTPDGSTYMVYLCGRPLPNRGRCTLGRETAIQKMVWGEDGWLRTVAGDGLPTVETEAPRVAAPPIAPPPPAREHFDGAQLPIDFQWLRSPWPDELFSLTERPGFLRLYGRETVGSLFRQALVARRQQSHCYSASTIVEFEPRHFQQMAGLICYYNSSKFHYLHHLHGRRVRQARSGHVGAARPGAGGRVHSPARDSVECRRGTARRDRLRTSAFRVSRQRCRHGPGFRSNSMPASSPTKRRRRGCRTSRAPSSASRARTCPAHAVPLISTGSSTSSGRTASVRLVPITSERGSA